MTDGYIYCFSNQSMPGILKIGMTERTPEIRLNEANRSDTWRPPTLYKIEFAKKVLNPKQKELFGFNSISPSYDFTNKTKKIYTLRKIKSLSKDYKKVLNY